MLFFFVREKEVGSYAIFVRKVISPFEKTETTLLRKIAVLSVGENVLLCTQTSLSCLRALLAGPGG